MLFDLSRSLTLTLALTGMVRCTANPEAIIESSSVEPDSVADTLDFPRMPEFLPAPDVEARQSQKKASNNDRWARVAQQKGKEAFEQGQFDGIRRSVLGRLHARVICQPEAQSSLLEKFDDLCVQLSWREVWVQLSRF